jgi:hypothetical protein
MSKRELRKGGIVHGVDMAFQKYAQIQIVIPHSIFAAAGLELNYANVMQIVDEAILPMLRFKGFQCDRRFWQDKGGDARVVLTKPSMGDILYLKLPNDFVLPPSIKQLPSKTPEDLALRLDEL